MPEGLIGQHHGESERAQNLGLEIISHMRKRMDQLSQERKLNFTLLATPAEGLSGRFVKMDRKRFALWRALRTGNTIPIASISRFIFPLTPSRKSGWKPPIMP